MIDAKIRTLLAVAGSGSYTRAAEQLCLTQPAVSHHIHQLEEEYGIKIFFRDKKALHVTDEGAVLIKYARRAAGISNMARQAIEDIQRQVTHLNIGMTQTVGENTMPQVIGLYCEEHPHVRINICTDTINNIYTMIKSYELDIGIVEGKLPVSDVKIVLLDTDYLCLIVSPLHPLAKRASVGFSELKREKMILRSPKTGTRLLLDSYLANLGSSVKDLNVIIEMDNVTMIKELVSLNMGISIIAHSICREEEQQGKLAVVPIENSNMIRQINMVHHPDFSHQEVLDDLRHIYRRLNR